MPTKATFFTFSVFFLYLGCSNLSAQKDTEFWFVAPEITQGLNNYDRPVSFWVSTYDKPATIVLSQPANPGFPPQIISLNANTSGQFTFPPFHDLVENTPPNTVLNKGFLIEATTPITAYYEIVGEYKSNPEIFSLKGKNALGKAFYTPFQTLMANSDAHLPPPHAAFDIVATENGTSVSITPSTAIVGHAAGGPFTITLNRGQTYCAEASGQSAAAHPMGSKVTSNKPIAITLKDDLLNSGIQYGGTCRDVIGDQMVPIERLGKRYIIQKGLLNSTEHAFVVGTEPNTQVKVDGNVQGLIGGGGAITVQVNGIHFIEASAPVYVFQITGNGCEIGAAIMPALDCSGSNSVRFVRPTGEPFQLFLTTRSGLEGGFFLNGSQVPTGIFSPVTGSNGEFVAATMSVSTSQVPVGFSSLVENSLGLFQMGFLNGQESATGCRYGFFSDFGNQVVVHDTLSFCQGESILAHGLTIAAAGNYAVTVPNPEGCDTLIEIVAQERTFLFSQQTVYFCPGSSIFIGGIAYSQPQEVIDTLYAAASCDTILLYSLQFSDLIPVQKTVSICPGASVSIHGAIYNQPGVLTDTLPSLLACDTFLTTTIEWAEVPKLQREIILCKGRYVSIGGVSYSQPGIIQDTVLAKNGGCDTLRSNILRNDEPMPFLPQDTFICAGDRITLFSPYPTTFWNGTGAASSYDVLSPGLVIASSASAEGCPRLDSIWIKTCCSDKNVYLPNIFSPNDDGQNDEFCLYATERCEQFVLRVYDRWGELLFESQQANPCWDGNYRGRSMSTGVYIWIVEFHSDRTFSREILKGSVTLLR